MTIGIMGGTFDPVHNGHITLATTAKEVLACDKILWIPTGVPPHKEKNADDTTRVAMLELAITGLSGHEIDTCEVHRQGYTRTVDTLHDLRARYPQDRLIFLIGGDTVLQLSTWKDFASVTQLCEFGVALRPSVSEDAIRSELLCLSQVYSLSYHLLPMDLSPISSTEIRRRVHEGADISGLVPKQVYDYIQTNRLYQD